MKFLMKVIYQMVIEINAVPNIITVTSVDMMFKMVSDKLLINIWDDQKQWLTVVRELQRRRIVVMGGDNAVF